MNTESNGFRLLRSDLQESLSGSSINPLELSRFQRILLTTDGMVTEMLEAYLQESIVVTKLSQTQDQQKRLNERLELNEGDNVMHRSILLTGKTSCQHHLYAQSAIAVDRLTDPVRDGLLNSRQPIGYLILKNRLETFREILVCEKEPAGELASHFNIETDDKLLSRTYLVFAGNNPIMSITEKFPEDFFPDD